MLGLDPLVGAGYVGRRRSAGWARHACPGGRDVDAKLIIDVGGHQGEDTLFYLQKGFFVVGIEADPSLYQSAQRSLCKYIDERRLTLVNVAVSAYDGEVTFYRNLRVTDWGTTSAEWAARNQRMCSGSVEIAVPGLRFEKILERYGV